jgi:hypothetical protein
LMGVLSCAVCGRLERTSTSTAPPSFPLALQTALQCS